MPNFLQLLLRVARKCEFFRSVRSWVYVAFGVTFLIAISTHQTPTERSNLALSHLPQPDRTSLDLVQQSENAVLGVQQSSYPVPAQNAFFVAPEGDEVNTGVDLNSPWTLAKALRDAPSGATLLLRGGTYRTGFRNSENGGERVNETLISKALTIQPYNDEIPILKGSLVAKDWARDGDAWKTTWIYHFPPGNGDASATRENPMAAYNDGVWVDEEPLWQVEGHDQVEPGTFYLDYDTDTLYVGTDPMGKTVEVTAFAMGFNNWQMQEPNVIIRGLTFMQYAVLAISLDSPNVLIENNCFIQNRNTGVFVGNPGVRRFEPYGIGAIVRNNDFFENGAKAAGTIRGHQFLFENNIVRNNNTKRAKYSSGGVKFVRSDGVIVRHNLFEKNTNVSVWFDVGSTNAQIVSNVIRNNDGDAIFWEISDQSIIAGNLIVNNPAGVRIAGSTNTNIFNNTFHNNSVTVFAPDPDRRNTQQGPGYTENIAIKNNIFSVINHSDTERILVFKTGICEQPLVSDLNYNVYYRSNLNQPEGLIEWEKYPYAENCQRIRSGTVYGSLEAFQRESGFESNGFEIGSGLLPLFLDAETGDYRLMSDSPAISAGSPLPPKIADALGWETDGAIDLGAYQAIRQLDR